MQVGDQLNNSCDVVQAQDIKIIQIIMVMWPAYGIVMPVSKPSISELIHKDQWLPRFPSIHPKPHTVSSIATAVVRSLPFLF